MKWVVAPDSFKGSLTAQQAADAMAEGILAAIPGAEIVKVPMADGGEGTVQSLVDATGGTFHNKIVQGPLGDPVDAVYGILGDGVTAVIEMAQASGMYLIEQQRRNPLLTTTYGTGQLIRDALDNGCRRFLVGIGGSATNDGGAGMAEALGVVFLDAAGTPVPRGGAALAQVSRIDTSGLDQRLHECSFTVACDVDNPLVGPQGASAIFGPQKGATPQMVQQLDAALTHFAQVMERDLGKSVASIPGAGAAGGLGAGLVAFVDAELKRGIELVIEAANLREAMQGAHVVLTGEGRTDSQTARGKTPLGVARVAKEAGVPTILLSGSLGDELAPLYEAGIIGAFSIMDQPLTVEEAMSLAYPLVRRATEQLARVVVGVGR